MCGSPNLSRPETAARLLPRDERNGPTVNLLNTPADFLPPGFFRGNVHRLIQTADQRIDQHAACFGREGQRIF